jgi:hypothetical protein
LRSKLWMCFGEKKVWMYAVRSIQDCFIFSISTDHMTFSGQLIWWERHNCRHKYTRALFCWRHTRGQCYASTLFAIFPRFRRKKIRRLSWKPMFWSVVVAKAAFRVKVSSYFLLHFLAKNIFQKS